MLIVKIVSYPNTRNTWNQKETSLFAKGNCETFDFFGDGFPQQDDVEVAYALVTPCGQPFGDLLQFRVEKKEVEKPICVILKAGNLLKIQFGIGSPKNDL